MLDYLEIEKAVKRHLILEAEQALATPLTVSEMVEEIDVNFAVCEIIENEEYHPDSDEPRYINDTLGEFAHRYIDDVGFWICEKDGEPYFEYGFNTYEDAVRKCFQHLVENETIDLIEVLRTRGAK